MSIQKLLPLTQDKKLRSLNKLYIVLILAVALLTPLTIQYFLQTLSYDTPNDTHPITIAMAPKGSDSDPHPELNDKHIPIHFIVHVSDSPSFVESTSVVVVKAVHATHR